MMNSGYRSAVFLFGLCICGGTVAADVSAEIRWSQRVQLGTPVSGVVSEVHVRPGTVVSKGDKLISLDARSFSAQVDRRLADFKHAQATLEEAKREDERAIELYDRTVLSDFERNQAQIALYSARAGAERARAELVDARLDLERSMIHAPFDGVVLSVDVAPGQTIVSDWQSQPMVTIANDRVFNAHAQIDAEQAKRLEPGGQLRAVVRGEERQASVSFIGFEPVGQSDQGPRYELVVEIAVGNDRRLRVGEMVTLHLD